MNTNTNIWNDNSQGNNRNIWQNNHQAYGGVNNNKDNNVNSNPNSYHLQQQQQLSPDLLISKLANLSANQSYNNFISSLDQDLNYSLYNHLQFNNNNNSNNTFNLPLELQGGVSNISTRRPSFAAEQSYTANNSQGYNLMQPVNPFHHSFQNNLLHDFRSRRPSIQFNPNNNNHDSNNQKNFNNKSNSSHNNNHNHSHNHEDINENNNGNTLLNNTLGSGANNLELENGLLLNGNMIITSPNLQKSFETCRKYFSVDSASQLYQDLKDNLQTNQFLQKIVLNLKKLNNLFALGKPLVLVLTKSGKFEILSTPMNSNIFLQPNDMVIVDGDRGKDLVYILEPSISLDVAILVNYLKKRQHSKSINYGNLHENTTGISNTVKDLCNGQGILDEETQFQIPTKQVLRFATFQEISNLGFKLLEEIKSYKTSVLKISNLPNLYNKLVILSSEYQFDQKKLTFYYYADQRLDFRNLIKELFKIYKTRIWLCAVPEPPTTSQSCNPLNDVNINEVKFENFVVDNFHVRNFEVTLDELSRE